MLAAKALHSILCHDELEHAGERTQGRLRKLLQLAHPLSAADRGTAGVYAQEAFRLLQCIALAGAQHAADVEMISYLRDLAVCYVCECGRIAPAMSPAALLAFKQLRHSMVKVPAGQRPSSAPVPAQGAPGSSGWPQGRDLFTGRPATASCARASHLRDRSSPVHRR